MSSVATGIVSTAYKLAFEISPIFLTGGIATSLINSATQAVGLNVSVGTGVLPIVAITQAASFGIGILTGNPPINLDAYFAHFVPLAGSTLADYDVSTYPFANQTVAANAMIAKGLNISLEMICPAAGELGFASKLATMELLTSTINKHVQLGGTFTVLTGAQLYTNCLLKRIVDISAGDTAQRQWRYQWDFFQPLITLDAAQVSQNNLISKISGGLPTDGSLSGASNIINQPPVGAVTQTDFTSAGALG